jgi:cell division GTPase FtsZ
MCADDLETVAGLLDRDIVVAGPAAALETSEKRAEVGGQPRVVGIENDGRSGDAIRDADVLVVAMDGSTSVADSLVQVASDAAGFVVAVFDGHGDDRVDPSLLDHVREAVDATVLACRTHPTPESPSDRSEAADARTRQSRSAVAVGGAFDFVRILRRPGHVNLDLADARSVLTEGSLAVLGGGTASLGTGGSRRAVQRAFEQLPSSIDAAAGSAALVSVAGGPTMSIGDAVTAARAVRTEAGAIDDLIWGVAVEDALVDQVTVDVVVDDIAYSPPLSAGDPCQRCGAALTEYTFGERQTLACEACGFADLSTSLGHQSEYDAET